MLDDETFIPQSWLVHRRSSRRLSERHGHQAIDELEPGQARTDGPDSESKAET